MCFTLQTRMQPQNCRFQRKKLLTAPRKSPCPYSSLQFPSTWKPLACRRLTLVSMIPQASLHQLHQRQNHFHHLGITHKLKCDTPEEIENCTVEMLKLYAFYVCAVHCCRVCGGIYSSSQYTTQKLQLPDPPNFSDILFS